MLGLRGKLKFMFVDFDVGYKANCRVGSDGWCCDVMCFGDVGDCIIFSTRSFFLCFFLFLFFCFFFC